MLINEQFVGESKVVAGVIEEECELESGPKSE
jgi:hypothetical protein